MVIANFAMIKLFTTSIDHYYFMPYISEYEILQTIIITINY